MLILYNYVKQKKKKLLLTSIEYITRRLPLYKKIKFLQKITEGKILENIFKTHGLLTDGSFFNDYGGHLTSKLKL